MLPSVTSSPSSEAEAAGPAREALGPDAGTAASGTGVHRISFWVATSLVLAVLASQLLAQAPLRVRWGIPTALVMLALSLWLVTRIRDHSTRVVIPAHAWVALVPLATLAVEVVANAHRNVPLWQRVSLSTIHSTLVFGFATLAVVSVLLTDLRAHHREVEGLLRRAPWAIVAAGLIEGVTAFRSGDAWSGPAVGVAAAAALALAAGGPALSSTGSEPARSVGALSRLVTAAAVVAAVVLIGRAPFAGFALLAGALLVAWSRRVWWRILASSGGLVVYSLAVAGWLAAAVVTAWRQGWLEAAFAAPPAVTFLVKGDSLTQVLADHEGLAVVASLGVPALFWLVVGMATVLAVRLTSSTAGDPARGEGAGFLVGAAFVLAGATLLGAGALDRPSSWLVAAVVWSLGSDGEGDLAVWGGWPAATAFVLVLVPLGLAKSLGVVSLASGPGLSSDAVLHVTVGFVLGLAAGWLAAPLGYALGGGGVRRGDPDRDRDRACPTSPVDAFDAGEGRRDARDRSARSRSGLHRSPPSCAASHGRGRRRECSRSAGENRPMTDRNPKTYASSAGGFPLERWRDDPKAQAALAAAGCFMVHGAAFRLADTAVLAVGPSGAGKSTLVAAALSAGGSVCSDDLVVLRSEAEGVLATSHRPFLSFRDSGRRILEGHSVIELLKVVPDVMPDRTVLALSGSGELWSPVVRPEVLWIVEVARTEGATASTELSQAAAFAQLMSCVSGRIVLASQGEVRARFVATVASLAAQCRPRRMRLGRDLLEDPVSTIRRLVAGG